MGGHWALVQTVRACGLDRGAEWKYMLILIVHALANKWIRTKIDIRYNISTRYMTSIFILISISILGMSSVTFIYILEG